jgi:hypothetical protein
MKPIVSLKDVVGEMEMQSNESAAYLNKRTGELITLSDYDLPAVEDEDDAGELQDWQKEMIQKTREVAESDDYLTLPSKYDIHEYRIMEEFCYSIQDQDMGDKLLDTIKGSGAFRRFKDAIRLLDIEEEWYRYRQGEFEKIAIDWLEEHEIPYSRQAEDSGN